MNAELQKANEAAAASPQVLSLGGRTFIVPVPGIADFFAQRAEARRQVQASAGDPIELLNQKITAAEKANRAFSPTIIAALTESALKAGTSKDAKMEPTDAQLAEQVTRPEMIRWTGWHFIRKADPTVTLKDVEEWTPTQDDVCNLAARLGAIMSLANLNPN